MPNATASSVLSATPYNFSSGLVGTTYLSIVIGAALGALWIGWSAYKLAIPLARRNKGAREPEQRPWMHGLFGVLCTAGLILWGVGASRRVHWFGPIVRLELLAFSAICGGSLTLSYDVDCFKVALCPISTGESISLPSSSGTLSDLQCPMVSILG